MNQARQKEPGGYASQVRSESDPCNRNVNVLIGVSGENEEYCWVTQSRPRSWWWVSGGLLSRLPKTTATVGFHASFCSHSDHLQMSLWVPKPNSPPFGREDVPAGSGLASGVRNPLSSIPAKPRQRKPNLIQREGYSQARFQRHGLRLCGRPGIRNQRSGPTRRTRPRTPFRYQAGIRKFRGVSLSSAPWECRTPTCLKTRSEHGLLYPNTAGHQHVPSCTTFPSLHVAGIDL